MRKNPYKIYCYDKITKVSEYLKEMHRSTAEIKTLDCGMAFVDSETEKAWVLDYRKLYEDHKCSRKFYYVPKSQCKVLENDHYVNEDGTLVTDRKFILLPAWLERKVGA